MSRRPGSATRRQAGCAQIKMFFLKSSLALNLLVDCCLPPAIDPCNTTDTATLTTLHPPSKTEFIRKKCKHTKIKLKIFRACAMFEVVPTAFQVVPTAPFHLVDAPPQDRMLQFCNKMGL